MPAQRTQFQTKNHSICEVPPPLTFSMRNSEDLSCRFEQQIFFNSKHFVLVVQSHEQSFRDGLSSCFSPNFVLSFWEDYLDLFKLPATDSLSISLFTLALQLRYSCRLCNRLLYMYRNRSRDLVAMSCPRACNGKASHCGQYLPPYLVHKCVKPFFMDLMTGTQRMHYFASHTYYQILSQNCLTPATCTPSTKIRCCTFNKTSLFNQSP